MGSSDTPISAISTFACIDAERQERIGYPEAVYCAGKTDSQSFEIIRSLHERGIPVLATKANPALASHVLAAFPGAICDETARTITLGVFCEPRNRQGLISVVCAGTSDIPVAMEAVRTAEFFGSMTELICDVGVAGIHRLFSRLSDIRKARVIIAVAGMEAALSSVLAGLVSAPIIAVPTGTGYGASFGGLAALLGMLNACAPGISVVNIDNGFGAGYQANMINKLGGA
ncbi:MAG: nickel pincer cofactor biosynthesis protein LarB [Treponema sp.]|jgi:NCAIR mutase (PurE)-related protein|nr:nickel pincer cofactor biosynthesis protein LarB [Treponema sp.]